MSVIAISREFNRRAVLLRKAVLAKELTVAEAKVMLHDELDEIVSDHLDMLKDQAKVNAQIDLRHDLKEWENKEWENH